MIRERLAEILEIDEDRITLDSDFADDLDADSLALIELVEALEEELGERTVGLQHRRRGPRRPADRARRGRLRRRTGSERRRPDGRAGTRCTPTASTRAARSRSAGRFRDARRARPGAGAPVVVRRAPRGRRRTSGSSSSATPCSASSSPTTSTGRYPEHARRASSRRCGPSVVNAEVLAEVAAELDARRRACCSARARTRRAGARSRRSSPTRWRRSSPRCTSTAGWSRRPRARAAAARATASPRRRPARAAQDYKTRLQELAAQRFDQLPRYQVRDEGPDHAKRFFADGVAPRARSTARARDVRRSRPSRPRRAWRGNGCRARRAAPPPTGGTVSGWGMPELPEVEVLRRDLEREVVGKKVKAVDVDGMRTIRRHQQPQAVHRRGWSAEDHRRSSGGASTCSCSSTAATCSSIHLGMSGQLLRAKSSRETMAKHTHVVITFTQGGQLRFVDPRTFGEMFVTEPDGVEKEVDRARPPRARPARDGDVAGSTSAMLVAQRHAKLKAAADGPEVHRRHRQHLHRRDPLRRRAALGPHERRAAARRRCGASTASMIETLQDGGEAPRVVAGRRAVRRPVRQAGRVPAPPPGVRPGGAGVPAVPPRDRAREGGGRSTFFCPACQV